ncbi:hypothetical protein [Massilia timonae]|uniref:hypothetical protein n=1 Tax=Massilia timonae TaxID=47229 RepID=UPI0028D28C8C|nr:hypothetical protein [Massilia timonae]
MYPTVSFAKTLALYLTGVIFCFAVLYVSHHVAPDAPFFAQLIVIVLAWSLCGYGLNRQVLHPLIQNDTSLWATIDSQSNIKIACFFWWPIKYPELIVRLFFVRSV